MALITCPECGKADVSETAERCPNCGYSIKAYREQQKEKQVTLLAEELEMRRQQDQVKFNGGGLITLGVVVVIIVILVGSCISASKQPASSGTILWQAVGQTTNAGQETSPSFHGNGKITLVFSCQATSAKGGTMQFALVDQTGSDIWKHSLNCPEKGSDTLTLPEGQYSMATVMNGAITWSMIITQV